jgi:polyphosphate kinase 2 (PPK2 family)
MPSPKLSPLERFVKAQTETKAKEAKRQAEAKRQRDEERAHLDALYLAHLAALAQALDAAGLGGYDVSTLAPHFKALAAHLLTVPTPTLEEGT